MRAEMGGSRHRKGGNIEPKGDQNAPNIAKGTNIEPIGAKSGQGTSWAAS